MKNTTCLNLLILIYIVLSSSCMTPRFYTPNRNPVPYFKKKGDMYLDLSVNIFNKADATLGYAPINGLGAYAGVGASSQSSSSVALKPEVPFTCKGQFENYGLGYFLSEKRSKHFRFEIYGDFLHGKYSIIKTPYWSDIQQGAKTAKLKGEYQKIGLLTNVGYSNRDWMFECGYTARFSNLKFYNPSIVERDRLNKEMDRLDRRPDYYVLEHGLFAKYGKAVAVQVQIALYHGFYVNSETYPVQQFNMAFMVGFVLKPNILEND